MSQSYLLEGVNSRGTFFLKQAEGQELGRLLYPKWYSSKAEFYLMGDTYRIQPKNLFRTKHLLYWGQEIRGEIRFDWRGRARISLLDDRGQYDFLIKRRGITKITYELMVPAGSVMAIFSPKLIWKKLTYDHTCTWVADGADDRSQALLIMICGFCFRIMRQQNSGG